MTVAPESPTHKHASFNCPRCGALAAQEWSPVFKEDRGSFQVLSDPQFFSPWASGYITPEWEVSHCYSCKKFALWVQRTLVFPEEKHSDLEKREPNSDMPEGAAQLFREAVAVLPHSKRAAAALCRASLEHLIKEVDSDAPRRASLDERLVRLQERVSSGTIQMLNVLRHVGNTALHGAQDDDATVMIFLDEDDATIAEAFFYAIDALVDELITKPRESSALYKSLPDGVRQSFERKAAAAKGGGQ